MDTEKMFELADRLRALRDEKAEAEQHLKEIKAEMDEVDYRLSELIGSARGRIRPDGFHTIAADC